MTAAIHTEMHADHTHWNSEAGLWDERSRRDVSQHLCCMRSAVKRTP